MESSELDDQRAAFGVLQFRGADRAVGTVGPHPHGERETDRIEHGGDRARHRTQTAGSLADVVEQRGLDGRLVAGEDRSHPAGYVDGVALIGRMLLPEQPRAVGGKHRVDEVLIVRRKRPGGEEPEEPSGEVTAVPDPSAQLFDLQSTHRREVGRYAIRSALISSPQVAQIP